MEGLYAEIVQGTVCLSALCHINSKKILPERASWANIIYYSLNPKEEKYKLT